MISTVYCFAQEMAIANYFHDNLMKLSFKCGGYYELSSDELAHFDIKEKKMYALFVQKYS